MDTFSNQPRCPATLEESWNTIVTWTGIVLGIAFCLAIVAGCYHAYNDYWLRSRGYVRVLIV
jgi:hypothetical protein